MSRDWLLQPRSDELFECLARMRDSRIGSPNSECMTSPQRGYGETEAVEKVPDIFRQDGPHNRESFYLCILNLLRSVDQVIERRFRKTGSLQGSHAGSDKL